MSGQHQQPQNQSSKESSHALTESAFDEAGTGQFMAAPSFQLKADSFAGPPVQRKAASGGMGADLLNGFASNTGHDLSNVNVHRNSSKPSEVGALAFAQGNDIHLGPGQEQHLPHEAAHIVQQREGRVKPTTSVNGMAVNDDKGLESEADAMGGKAMQMKSVENVPVKVSGGKDTGLTVQRFQAPMQLVLDGDDITTLAKQVNTAVSGWGTDEEGVYVALQKLNRSASEITKLKTEYKKLFKATLEADIRGDFSGEELVFALELINIKDDAKAGNTIETNAPANNTEYDTAVNKLTAAMAGLGTEEEEIYAVLLPFNRDAIKLGTLKTKYQTSTSRKLDDDLKAEMSSSELAYALYLLNAPAPNTTLSAPGIGLTGKEDATGAVPGGNISVRTGDELTGTAYNELFSLEYEGGLANETRWLQFIWREIISTDSAGVETRLGDSITTSGGTYNLTTDPASPSYNTDTNSATEPFYEAGFLSGRTADATTIYDQPSSMDAKVQGQFAAGAAKVVSRAHFNTFLIRDFRPVHKVAVTVEWSYSAAAVPPRVQSVDESAACTSLPEGMKAKLVQQFPNYSYIE